MKYEIVMPMAGLGSRFKEEGFDEIKPLILLNKRPLFVKALNSLKDIINDSRISLIICKEDQISEKVEKCLKQTTWNYQIIEIDKRTQGPAETLFHSKNHINHDLPLLSLDCDLYFSCQSFFKEIVNGKDHLLCYFNSTQPRYSYIKTDTSSQVIDIAEKNPISDKALIGAYFFRQAETLFDLNVNFSQTEEVFISHLIKKLLTKDAIFTAYPSDQHLSFGTPEELKLNLKNFKL